MKKVFVPTMDELYKMQDMGANIYKYLLVKTIETLVVDGINYPNKGMLKSTYKYFKEDPYIAPAICMMYPEEIQYSKIASMDVNLCIKLLNQENTKTKCNLDYLSKFDEMILKNTTILGNTIVKLDEEFENNPKYRFEYIENELVRRIIDREITDTELILLRNYIVELLNIEPAYGLSLGSYFFKNDEFDRKYRISRAIDNYADTYCIPRYVGTEYLNKDILTTPSTEVKRLIKCINHK